MALRKLTDAEIVERITQASPIFGKGFHMLHISKRRYAVIQQQGHTNLNATMVGVTVRDFDDFAMVTKPLPHDEAIQVLAYLKR